MVLINGEVYGGLKGELYHESDYKLGGVVNRHDIAAPKFTFWDNKIEYDQRSIPDGQNDCTLVSAMSVYSDLTGYRFTREEHIEIHNLAVEATDGSIVSEGWYLPKAMDLIRHYVADKGLAKVSSARVLTGGVDFLNALEMGFSLQVGYGGNKRYNDAKDNDGEMSLTERGAPTYYHAVRRSDNIDLFIIDNYGGRLKYNTYTIPHFKEIVESGQYFFTRSYFYFQEITLPMTNLPPHLKPESASTPLRRETIIAWENEIGAWLNNDGDVTKLFATYEGAEDDVIMRMIVDLRLLRSGIL